MTLSLENHPLSNTPQDKWPSTVDLKFIIPGLVYYEDLRNNAGEIVGGTVLVKKEALDKMASSLKGKPIINWDHRKVSAGEYKKGGFQGIITSEARFNSADGWYHAEALIWDEATRKNAERGYSISCAYVPSEVDVTGGTLNKVPYQAEVLNGEYTHVAVVPVPRYEGARIELLNSAKGGSMNIMSLFRKDKPEEKVEVDIETAKVAIEGQGDVPLTELINSFKKAEALKKSAAGSLADTDTIEVDGKKVTVGELKNAHIAMYNDAEKKDLDEKHNSGAHSAKALSNCAMCNSAAEEAKKKDEEEKKNAAEAEEKKKKEDAEKQNAAKLTAEQNAKKAAEKEAARLEELRNGGRKLEMPKLVSVEERQKAGEERYGVVPAAK